MKGLLKKDLALLANTGKSYVGVLLFCMVLGLVNGEMKQFSLGFLVTVSYTHLTLPTICSV